MRRFGLVATITGFGLSSGILCVARDGFAVTTADRSGARAVRGPVAADLRGPSSLAGAGAFVLDCVCPPEKRVDSSSLAAV